MSNLQKCSRCGRSCRRTLNICPTCNPPATGPWEVGKKGSDGGWYVVRRVETGKRGPFGSKQEAKEAAAKWNAEWRVESIADELLACLERILETHQPLVRPGVELERKARELIARAKGGEA